MSTKKVQKPENIYECLYCYYITSRQSHYNRHCSTAKHKKHILSTFVNKKEPYDFACECGKHYKGRDGLWRHKKKCIITENNKQIENDLVKQLIKDNITLKNDNKELNDIIKQVASKVAIVK